MKLWKKEMVKKEQLYGLGRDWEKGEGKWHEHHFRIYNLQFQHRSQNDIENLPEEIIEVLEKVQKSPELQSILAERLQTPYVIYVPSGKFLIR